MRAFLATTAIVCVASVAIAAEDWSHENVLFFPEWVAKFAAAHDYCAPLAGKPDPVFSTQTNPEVPEWMNRFSVQYAAESYRETLSAAELRLMDHNYKIGTNDVKTFACFGWLPQLETMYLETIVEVNSQ
jgi:hypothetical protein